MDMIRGYGNMFNGYLSILPNVVTALIVFLIGWLIISLVSKGIRKLLAKTNWDDKLFEMMKVDPKFQSDVIISKIVYYALMIYLIILVFNLLNLHFVAQPIIAMMTVVVEAIPNIIMAGLILLFAWIAASILSALVQRLGKVSAISKLLYRWNIIEDEEGLQKALSAVGRVVFYLVLLLFLPGVLGALHIAAISQPLEMMLSQFLQFIPKLVGAALTLLIGWLIAKIVRVVVTNFLKNIGADNMTNRLGLGKIVGEAGLSSIVGTIAFIVIMIPIVISALETLDLRGISEPAVAMLNTILTMIPNIIIAILLVLVGVWLGGFIGKVVAGLLERLGSNNILSYLGLGKWESASTTVTVSQLVGRMTQVVIVLLFTVEALQVVQLQVLVVLATGLIAYLPNIFTAIVIIGLGLFLGQFVMKLLLGLFEQRYVNVRLLALMAKYTIIVLAFFMSLDQLGVASSIVNAAFILVLGGLALAFGLSFGLGGRDFAAKVLRKWEDRVTVSPTEQNGKEE